MALTVVPATTNEILTCYLAMFCHKNTAYITSTASFCTTGGMRMRIDNLEKEQHNMSPTIAAATSVHYTRL